MSFDLKLNWKRLVWDIFAVQIAKVQRKVDIFGLNGENPMSQCGIINISNQIYRLEGIGFKKHNISRL